VITMNGAIWRVTILAMVMALTMMLAACEWGRGTSGSDSHANEETTDASNGDEQTGELNEPELAITQGYITDKGDATLLVTAYIDKGEDSYVDAYSLRISDQTKITTGTAHAISLDELDIGMSVEVWTVGPVAESYPMQAAAVHIIVHPVDTVAPMSRQEAVRTAIEAQNEVAGPWAVKDARWNEEHESWEIVLVHPMYMDEPFAVRVDARSGEILPNIVLENDAFRVYYPHPETRVGKTFTVEGEARVFEAAFSWVLEDGHSVLAEGHEMASAGAPEWGSFSFEVSFDHASQPNVMLVLFVYSPRDGSMEKELVIPLTVEEDLIQYSAESSG